jgi:hypothetical protein
MNEDNLARFSTAIRWFLGAVFTTVGIIYVREGGWPAILFGAVMIITGFFRPRRCLGSENGDCDPHIRKQS